jgi:hypothetical protein
MTTATGGPEVGSTDGMSEAAARARVPLCGQRGCTRAAGHDEIMRNNFNAPVHVITDDQHRIIEVWYR